ADLAALLGHVAVQVLHLGPTAPHHVLEKRGAAARQFLGLLGHVALHFLDSPSLHGVDEALGLDAPDGLDLVAAGPPDLDRLGGQVDGYAPHARARAHFGRSQTRQTSEAVGHAVDRELGPALAPEIGRHLRGSHITHDPGKALGPLGRFAVVLADLAADGGPVSPDGVAGLVHAGADGDHAAQA